MKKICGIILSIFLPITMAIPVYADTPADLSYTITSTSDSHEFCGYSNTPSCDSYQYVTWTTTNSTVSSIVYASNTVTVNGTAITNRLNMQPNVSQSYSEVIVGLSKFKVSGTGLNSLFTADSTATVTVTLSASQSSTPCPECPTCPDCNDPFIVRLFSQGFWGVATAVAALIVPILALFLVFRLVHDLLFRERL